MFGTSYFITQRDKHAYSSDILNVIVFSVLRGEVLMYDNSVFCDNCVNPYDLLCDVIFAPQVLYQS